MRSHLLTPRPALWLMMGLIALTGCVDRGVGLDEDAPGAGGEGCQPGALLACPSGYSAYDQCPPGARCVEERGDCGEILFCAPNDAAPAPDPDAGRFSPDGDVAAGPLDAGLLDAGPLDAGPGAETPDPVDRCPLTCPEGFQATDDVAALPPGGFLAYGCDEQIACSPVMDCFETEPPGDLCPEGTRPADRGLCRIGEQCFTAVGPCGGQALCVKPQDCDLGPRCPRDFEPVEVCEDDSICVPWDECGADLLCALPRDTCLAEPTCAPDQITVSACPMDQPCEVLDLCRTLTLCSDW